MPRIRKLVLFALIPLVLAFVSGAARAEKRIALVVGNAGYQAGELTTPANDAGLIAQTLQAAGFDVVGARDLDQDSLRRALRDFLDKAGGAGPDTVAVVYLSGYGLQLEGENYFVPIDAKIARDADVAAEAVRISDYTRPLVALKLKANIVILDAARANPFARSGAPLASGLALVEPEPGLLIAFNAAPGTVAPEGQGPYGPYAQALAEMMREGGLPLAQVFERVRLRVNDITKGAEVTWHASHVEAPFLFFERLADAPPPPVPPEQTAAIRARPIRELGAQQAYALALERDTLEGYGEFVDAYPDDPMAKRVRVIIAARREAITWGRTRSIDTPPAYWSYLRRYPDGPHAADAHRRLAYLAAAFEPPPTFAEVGYDVPPPPPEETVYIRRPVLVFDDPFFAFAPPPPPPVVFLAPPPPEYVVLVAAAPPPPIGLFVLPIPVYRPVPVWVSPPVYVAPPPPNNVIYNNVHNTVVVNNVTNTVTVTDRSGQTTTVVPPAPGAAQGTPAPQPVAAVGPALPPSVAQKAVTPQNQSAPAAGKPGTTAPTPGQAVLPGRPLPRAQGRPPLPSPSGTPKAAPSPTPATAPAAAPTATAKPATSPSPGPAATQVTPTSPPAAAKPATPSRPPPAAKLRPTPAATPPPSSSPPAAAKPATPAAPHPAAKLTPPPAPKPAAPPPPTPPPAAKPPPPPLAAKPPAPAPYRPAAVPPPAAATPPVAAPPRPPAPPPPPVAPRPAPPPPIAAPPKTPAPPPVAAAPRPPAPSPSVAAPRPPAGPPPQPQARGCPPGKSMAIVNGQPTCR
jgi:uncharacterized caspase-like protein